MPGGQQPTVSGLGRHRVRQDKASAMRDLGSRQAWLAAGAGATEAADHTSRHRRRGAADLTGRNRRRGAAAAAGVLFRRRGRGKRRLGYARSKLGKYWAAQIFFWAGAGYLALYWVNILR